MSGVRAAQRSSFTLTRPGVLKVEGVLYHAQDAGGRLVVELPIAVHPTGTTQLAAPGDPAGVN
jgi:hypothetical protein